jgi:hypothetical protein
MQTSIGAMFRAVLLLVCMVAIPAVAICGASLPNLVSAVTQLRWSKLTAQNNEHKLYIETAQFEPDDNHTFDRTPKSKNPIAPVSYQVALEPFSPPQNTSGSGFSTNERLIQIQDQLRRLGATYYLLESWGNQADYYRFCCKIAVGGNPNFTRHFQATHSDPLEAMLAVLRQVESGQEMYNKRGV